MIACDVSLLFATEFGIDSLTTDEMHYQEEALLVI
jgi:hypothetical protein